VRRQTARYCRCVSDRALPGGERVRAAEVISALCRRGANRRRKTSSADRAAQGKAPHPARARRPQGHAHQVPPRLRAQPPQALARPVDLHPHRRRRADQQPRRTRPPRRRHLPQALARQPIRTRRTHDRTTPLRLGHLPAPEPVALRLPHPRPRRPRPRRSSTRTHLTTGLNAYHNRQICRDFYGSDGTRTRDLRRDRPVQAQPVQLAATPNYRLEQVFRVGANRL
jgi:hypothetical protein